MSYEGSVIYAPVSVRDVSSVIGDISQDVGTLCTSSLINPCAKYKPTIYDSVGENMHQWKAMDGNCGLVPKQASGLASIPGLYDGKMNGWVYNRPGANNFKRLTDFIGYDHNARMAQVFCAANATTGETKFPIVLAEFAMADDSNRRSLRFSDIHAVSDGYLGVYAKSGAKEFYFTAPKKLSETTSSKVEINWKTREGTWSLYPILCAKYKLDGGNIPYGQTIYTIPMVSPVTVIVQDIEDILYVTGFASVVEGNTDALDLVVLAVNMTKSSRSFGTVYWQIKKDYGTLQVGDKNGTITDFGTIAAGTSASRTVRVTGCTSLIKRGYVVIRTYSNMSGIDEREIDVHFFTELPTFRPLD